MSTRTLTGTGRLLRFLIRRERRALPWWIGGVAALVGYQSAGSQSVFDTPEKLAALRETFGGNPAMVALSGPEELLATVGGEAMFEVFSYVAIIVALMNMFLIGRNTRADEESGRAELIRSARVGRRAPLAAALLLAGLANVAVGAGAFAAAAGTGLPIEGSVILGLATAGVGLTFAALTAVAVQIYESPRSAYGAVGLVLGAAYLLRAAGDAGTQPVLSWFSPIGWAQRTLPFVTDRAWPLLLPVAATAVLVIAAVALLDRRDFGAGVIPDRPGPATASRALRSPLGLAWRLQRGAFIGWSLGLFVGGVALGSFVESIEKFVAENPAMAELLSGDPSSAINSYLSLSMLLLGLVAASYGVSAALRARAEESSGRAEPVLATRTSRARWLGSHAVIAIAGTLAALVIAGFGVGLSYAVMVSDASQITRLIGIALAYAPATCAIVAVTVLGFGAAPRLAAPLAWAIVGLCGVVAIFADLVDLPEWVVEISPYSHTPMVPVDPLALTPLAALTLVTVALLLGGFAGLRRRDVGRA